MSSEFIRNAFHEENLRHLENVRGLRKHAWEDRDGQLSELESAVLGLSGSVELLNKYINAHKRIRAMYGEPVISIETIDDPNGTGQERHIRSGQAGIISGDLRVVRGLTPSDGPEGLEPVAFARFSIPVRLLLPYSYEGTELAWSGGEASEDSIEWSNIVDKKVISDGMNPSKDYSEAIPNVLLGRAAITQSQDFFRGLHAVYNVIVSFAETKPVIS